ncbi:MAG TPA: Hsp20/alpha crystallin family protein [Terriglobia bacterium]|nr:Hsp20/alpha crystallin family protein [Terriglobia bacterium]
MTTIRFQPFQELFEDQKQFDQLFGQDFRQDSKGEEVQPRAWTPAVDVLENDQKFTIKADLAGVDPKAVEILVHEDLLTIRGERKFENQADGANYHRIERTYGSFSRSFRLPPNVNPDGLTAEYQNGVLILTLQKREEAKPKSIRINVSNN